MIARADHEAMFANHPGLDAYRERILMIALCQGAALHYLNGKNGVKDLDVYTFYAAVPGVLLHPRRRRAEDFGESDFGYWSKEKLIRGQRFVGRRVDLLQRSLKVRPDADPVEAVRDWLRLPTGSSKELSKKAVIGIWPRRLLGKVVWPDGYSASTR